jgi:hypothetical protein
MPTQGNSGSEQAGHGGFSGPAPASRGTWGRSIFKVAVAYWAVTSSGPTSDPLGETIESAIVAVSPLLDLVLSAGERLSRLAEPVDYEYYPVRDEDEESPRT